MISALLPMAVAVGTALGSGGSDDNPIPTLTEQVEVRVDVYGFSADNSTTLDHLFVFGHGEARFVRALPAGASVSWPLPEGGTEGVTLEILTFTSEGSLLSRSMSIDLGALTGGSPLLIVANKSGATGWNMAQSAAFEGSGNAVPTSSAVRSAVFSSSTGSRVTTEGAVFHVPSVTGLETTGAQVPPRLDDSPLPPI